MNFIVSKPVLSHNNLSYIIKNKIGEIVFEYPNNTSLERIVDVWPIIMNYYFFNTPFALGISDSDVFNPQINSVTKKSSKISKSEIKYENDFPVLKKKLPKQKNITRRLYRPVTLKEINTDSFVRFFKETCISNRILCPPSNNINKFIILQAKQKELIIRENNYQSHIYYDVIDNKIKTYYYHGFHNIEDDFKKITTQKRPKCDGYRYEQLLVLSGIYFD